MSLGTNWTGLSQSVVDKSEVTPRDALGEVFVPKHSRKVWCMFRSCS